LWNALGGLAIPWIKRRLSGKKYKIVSI